MEPYRGKHSKPQGPSSMMQIRQPMTEPSAVVPKKKAKGRAFALIIVVLLFICILFGFFAPFFPTIEHTVWACDSLSSDVGNIRIVFVSDIHYGFFYNENRLHKLVSQINSLYPDILIFGGDYGNDIDSSVEFFNKLSEHTLHVRYKILGVFGDKDTDHSEAQNKRLSDAMKNASVTPLYNSVDQVLINNGSIWIAGVDDPTFGSPNIKSVASATRQDDFVVFVAHNPSILQEAQQTTDKNGKLNWFDLALFGHTHGGQIPFLGDSFGLTYGIDEHYQSGWLDENRVPILISNGLGTVHIPFRYFAPAQIHQIDLNIK